MTIETQPDPGEAGRGGLYRALGLSERATAEDIRKAYHERLRDYHPDSAKGASGNSGQIELINRAAAILRDPQSRRLYDLGRIDEFGRLVRSEGRERWRTYLVFAVSCAIAFGCAFALAMMQAKSIAPAEKLTSQTASAVSESAFSKVAVSEAASKSPPQAETSDESYGHRFFRLLAENQKRALNDKPHVEGSAAGRSGNDGSDHLLASAERGGALLTFNSPPIRQEKIRRVARIVQPGRGRIAPKRRASVRRASFRPRPRLAERCIFDD